MCLCDAKIIKPEDDLICYKIFREYTCDDASVDFEKMSMKWNDKIVSYFRNYVFELNRRMVAECSLGDGMKFYMNEVNGHHYIQDEYKNVESGVFHSFKHLYDAAIYLRLLSTQLFYGDSFESLYSRIFSVNVMQNVTLRKCIIPKDSNVVLEGDFEGSESYASSDIIVTPTSYFIKFDQFGYPLDAKGNKIEKINGYETN